MQPYFAFCSRQPGNALIAAECRSLTAATPDENGLAACASIDQVAQSAYIHSGLRRLAQAPSLDELAAQVAVLGLATEGFRIELLRLSEDSPLDRGRAITALANAIPAYPNLDHPQVRYVLIDRPDGMHFTQIIIENTGDYKRHQSKPYHTSSSLPAQLARGMVNLVVQNARSILDPCCGTGSLLLEACALGLQAYGSDRSPAMVGMTRRNLAHFGYTAAANRQDARQTQQTADAVVTDLPYGRFLQMDSENVKAILANCARLAPQAVFAAGADLSGWLEEAGYTEIEVLPVQKDKVFTRFIHRTCSRIFSGQHG
jgi:tRNA G10  N-methylase Trm11